MTFTNEAIVRLGAYLVKYPSGHGGIMSRRVDDLQDQIRLPDNLCDWNEVERWHCLTYFCKGDYDSREHINMNFWNPFKKQEPVEIRSYTDALTNAYIAQALDGTQHRAALQPWKWRRVCIPEPLPVRLSNPRMPTQKEPDSGCVGFNGPELKSEEANPCTYLNVEDGAVVLHPVGSVGTSSARLKKKDGPTG